MGENRQLFMVQREEGSTSKFFTFALDREGAKRAATFWFGHDPDKYVVTPLTDPGDRIKLDVILHI